MDSGSIGLSVSGVGVGVGEDVVAVLDFLFDGTLASSSSLCLRFLALFVFSLP